MLALVWLALPLLALLAPAHAQVLYDFPNMTATYYYDNTMGGHLMCSKHAGGVTWSDDVLSGSTACGASVRQLKTNSVVAMNVTWMNMNGIAARAEDLCGREIQLFRNGARIATPNPLFLWEACQACATLPRVDLSVSAYVAATGDEDCMQGAVGGIDVRVMENYIRRAGAGSLGASTVGVFAAVALGLGMAGF